MTLRIVQIIGSRGGAVGTGAERSAAQSRPTGARPQAARATPRHGRRPPTTPPTHGTAGGGADTGPERSGGQSRGAPQAAESQSAGGIAKP